MRLGDRRRCRMQRRRRDVSHSFAGGRVGPRLEGLGEQRKYFGPEQIVVESRWNSRKPVLKEVIFVSV